METNKSVILVVMVLFVGLSNNASLSVFEQKKYKNLIEGQGLYTADDDVEVLTNANFKSRVYGQKDACLVEFYNSWCGFCQRFAPTWKALATDIKGWRDVVRVGAVDCSDNENSDICRNFEIMVYPTLRYFHPQYEEGAGKLGKEIMKGEDLESHKANLLEHMVVEQLASKTPSLPYLLPYTKHDVLHLFDNVKTKYAFLLIDAANSTLGAQLALDFHKYDQIVIRYAKTDNKELIKHVHANSFPFMMVINDSSNKHIFPNNLKTREQFRSVIIDYVKPDIIVEKQDNSKVYKGKWINVEISDMESLMEAKLRKSLREKIREMGDAVFQVDLETALRHTLKYEIGSKLVIKDEMLVALTNYLNLLVKYFPFGIDGRNFLIELQQIVKGRTNLDGSEIADMVSKHEDKKVFSSKYKWLACDGSSPEHRGFPCGLWKLFHFLTVQAADQGTNHKEVLPVMLGYVKHFFGCDDCSQHFQEMVISKDMQGVASTSSAVLWLWMAHNDANKRLSGDATEDSEFPKIQFPSSANCPTCRENDKWNYNEVLRYLKKMYSKSNIRYIGSDSAIIFPGLDSPMPGFTVETISQVDSGFCFVLYLICFLLVLILIKVYMKRGYRKKMYTHDLLGKV